MLQLRFQRYFQNVRDDLAFWNKRWGTQAEFWSGLKMPLHFQHAAHRLEGVLSPRYWDWQHFREHMLKDAYEAGCIRVAAHGFKCTLHFGEFFSASDAIYAAGVFFSLSRSPWVDYAAMSTSFVTVSGQPSDPRTAQLLLAAAQPLATPTFFEGAVDRRPDVGLHAEAVKSAAMAESHGAGFSNW